MLPENLTKYIEIFLIFSPVFLSVFTLALVIKESLNKLEKYSSFWLLGIVLTAFGLIYAFTTNSLKGSTVIMLSSAFSNCWGMYLKIKKKKRKYKV